MLGQLRSSACPAALASISAGLLYSMLKAKSQAATGGAGTPLPPSAVNTPNTDVSLERYGIVAEIAAMCKWYSA
jgi:hypothetical protein